MAGSGDGDWWRGAVIYQVYPRSFQDSDGDGIGDLKGVTARLDHIASLGVDAIWVSPFFKSPMADMGYDVSDYRAVDPMFGTLADFDALLARAHALGLKIIIDQVISHTSDQHAWFQESRSSRDNPRADWYVWADPKPDGTAPNNWLSIFGGPAWEWDGTRMQYYMHSFLASQPDINFHAPAVQDAMIEEMRFWLDRGVDGFRLDACNHYFHDAKLRDNPPARRMAAHDIPETNPYGFQEHLYDKTQPENLAYLKRIRALLEEYPGTVAVGEVGDGERAPQTVGLYTSGGDTLHFCYTFDLFGTEFSPRVFRETVTKFLKASADGWVCWALSNHDVMRHVSRFAEAGDDPNRIGRLAIAILVALRGTICIYQGEELGLPEAEIAYEDLRDPYGIRFWPSFKGRDGCRTPMPWSRDEPQAGFSTAKPWLPIPGEHKARAVDVQEADPRAMLHFYRRALAWRRENPAIQCGDIDFVEAGDDILAFTRTRGGETILCLYNIAREPQDWPLPAAYATALADPLSAPGITVNRKMLRLPAYGWAFLRKPG
ncbi:alpha-glucosidase family protein [Rhizorhabdus dicambivorans]|uniref:Alpha-glucosidase n=1 Tax=Rhizorhabdus dicambivorans TaxID=1850238 RepID=A0A2A4G0V8_9SPHN|nr:alpha-glucosidase family protein [Rhizorhabdus dicambivorans]ATE65092.1 alpha-glucosidase [Rhizorhabdus dicambivorans]PCE44365.1 alpha-glucosidase [Rhizorhabdus dicambivorans]